MSNTARFLNKNEYVSTKELITECFGQDEEFLAELYGRIDDKGCCTGVIGKGIAAAIIDDDGSILAVVMAIIKRAVPAASADEDKVSAYAAKPGYAVPYIMGVCTKEQYRHHGFMDRLMGLVIERLSAEGYPWCFLVAVDKAIYRHLGFIHDWKLTDRERDMLYADDGLDTASGRLLNAESIESVRIEEL